MRLHRLSVTAFGPFRDEQVVDFDALSDAGLFLLTGRTGAGKTSLLDAVTYALYGQVPGVRAGAMRVRSDHAADDTPTVVEIELTVRGTRLRVRRSPERLRLKRRGEGSTRERGSVLMERWRDGAWEFVSGRHDEVGHELGELLGMTCDQFCQVVLLPQGDFAAFLRADAEARKRLLEQLFGTERFSSVEGWLGALKSARGEAFEQELHRRRDLVSRLAEVSGEAAQPGHEAPDAETLSWADAVLAELGMRRSVAREEQRVATATQSTAEAEVARRRDIVARLQRLRFLRRREAHVAAGAAQRGSDAEELAAATRADALGPLLESVDDATETLAAARSVVAACRADVRRHGVDPTGGADELRARERELRVGLTRLHDLLLDVERLAELTPELAALQDRLGSRRDLDARHGTALAAGPAVRATLTARLQDGKLAARRLPDASAELVSARQRAAAAAERDDVRARRAVAADRCTAAVSAVQAARELALDLRERRLDGMAAELAAALRPGMSCPVCGGVQHPRPARSSDRVDEATERRAGAALERAEAALLDAETDARRLADDHAVARLAAGGDASPATLHEIVAALELSVRDLAAVASAAVQVEEELRSLDADLTDRSTAREAVRIEIRADEIVESALLAERARLERRLGAGRGDDRDVPTRVARLAAGVEGLAATAAAVIEEAHAATALAVAESRLGRAARAAGFPDAATAEVALRSARRRSELADAVAAYDTEARAVVATLAEPDLRDLPQMDSAVTEAALAEAASALAQTALQLRRADGEVARLDAAHRRALLLHGDVVGAVSRLGPLRKAFEDAESLARLAAGTGADNRLRMRLSYYVLSARLEQVAAAASERLLRMTDRRFSLRHTDERTGGNHRSGLGLVVSDGWYGTTRDPATLSGGESFMASLALALGLADVVVAEAGGQLMDTLFVDEGFGALDDQTLDAVLDVLDGLREGGRVVGVVSHVSELRDRIPAQLTVATAPEGSTLGLTA